MADSNSQQPRCPCGFWGSVQTAGYCSKCYREHQEKENALSAGGTGGTVVAEGKLSAASLARSLARVSPVIVDELTVSGKRSEGMDDVPEPPCKITVEDCASVHGSEPIAKKPAVSDEGSSTDAVSLTVPPDAGPDSSSDTFSSCSDRGTASSPNLENKDGEGLPIVHHPPQKSKKRCFKCNCKLELALREIGRCKCDYVFCQLHRLPEQHDCIFNHKEKGRQEARDKMIAPKKHIGTSLRRIDSDSY